MKVTCFLMALLFLGGNVLHAQHKVSKVKIHATGDVEKTNSLLGQLGVDHYYNDEDGIVAELGSEEVKLLRKSGHPYDVLVPDVGKWLDSVNKIYYDSVKQRSTAARSRVALYQPQGLLSALIPRPVAFDVKTTFGGYYSFPEMETAINNLVATYPLIASKRSIGLSAEGRNLWLVKISDNVATNEANEPEVLYVGLQHAREAITGSSMVFFMQYLCEYYYSDNRIRDLVNNREIFIIVCMNPDGWEFNRLQGIYGPNNPGGDWRKNRRVTSGTNIGVDLNRNWGVDWANCSAPILGNAASCGSGTPSADTYWGTAPFSEPETRAIRDFVLSNKLAAAFDQHAFGPYYSLPFGRKLRTMPLKGQQFFTAIPALMGKYNGMRAADSYDALGYEVAGGFKDWMFIGNLGTGVGLKDTVWAMTGEGGAGGGTTLSNGAGSFWAPAAQIVNLCAGMCYQNLQLAYAAGTYVDVEDANDIALTSRTGVLNARIKRLGLGNGPVTVSLIPLENMSGAGASVTLPSMVYYEEKNVGINYTLPAALGDAQRVRYAWRVTMDGYTYSDTITKLLNPEPLFFDNMESGTTPATSGRWVLPTGSTWNYLAGSGYGGTGRALSESGAGNYTSSQNVSVVSSSINLTGSTAAYLTFWVRHRAENFRDRVRIQTATNSTSGTNGTWTLATAGRTTVAEPGILDGATLNGQASLTGIQDYWVQEVIDLTPWLNTANFRFRFNFTSNAASGTFKYQIDEGFLIDNVKIVRSRAQLVLLPVTWQSVEAQLTSTNKVVVKWKAIEDASHDYYEVERSEDGKEFISLGRGDHVYEDKRPVKGNNFYRIKQHDKDGRIDYSAVVKVEVKLENPIVHLFPVPASTTLHVSLAAASAQRFLIQLCSSSGQVLQQASTAGGTIQSFDVQALAAGLYQVRVLTKSGQLVWYDKWVKL